MKTQTLSTTLSWGRDVTLGCDLLQRRCVTQSVGGDRLIQRQALVVQGLPDALMLPDKGRGHYDVQSDEGTLLIEDICHIFDVLKARDTYIAVVDAKVEIFNDARLNVQSQ